MPEENEQPTPIDPLTIGEIITLAEASEKSGFGIRHLQILAKAGRLKAKKSGSNWLTTLEAIEVYKNNRSFKNIPKKYRNKVSSQ